MNRKGNRRAYDQKSLWERRDARNDRYQGRAGRTHSYSCEGHVAGTKKRYVEIDNRETLARKKRPEHEKKRTRKVPRRRSSHRKKPYLKYQKPTATRRKEKSARSEVEKVKKTADQGEGVDSTENRHCRN